MHGMARELRTVRQINEACFEAANGRGRYVFADLDLMAGEKWRITRARSRNGVLQVRPLSFIAEGGREWFPAKRVYTD